MNDFWNAFAGKTLIIAELSANHGHKLETALETVRAAAASGADAIKLQTYTADTITLDCDNEYFRINQGTLWDGTTLYKLYQEAYTPWEWHAAIQAEAQRLGLIFFSTPFDPSAVDFLETLKVPVYKVASFEINDIPLIEYIARKGKPLIISTGIASLGEIEEAVAACHKAGNSDITLLKCTSAYPAPAQDANLRTIAHLADTFGVRAGLSDHTMGHAVAVAAVALGAKLIEKHFILDRSIGGPDASFSMQPDEFKLMVDSIRTVEQAVGTVSYALSEQVARNKAFSRSLFITRDIQAGELFTPDNVRSIRPGYGLHPRHLPEVLGKPAAADLAKGTPFSWGCIAWE